MSEIRIQAPRKVGEKLEQSLMLFSNHWYKVNLVYVIMTLFCGLLALLFLRLGTRKMSMRSPRGAQNMVEWVMDFTRNMVQETVPSEKFTNFIMPLALTMLVYLFIANWLGLIVTVNLAIKKPIPWLGVTQKMINDAHGSALVNIIHSPTASMSVALGLSLMVWVISHIVGLRHPRKYFKHYASPMFAIHLLEEITNPLTHGLRLFGNIFAGEALIAVILGVPYALGWIPMGLPLLVLWLLYSGFVSTIQAYVFTILLSLYIGGKYFEDDHAGAHA
jgi:F-type H+-transporting ATPase subunit a